MWNCHTKDGAREVHPAPSVMMHERRGTMRASAYGFRVHIWVFPRVPVFSSIITAECVAYFIIMHLIMHVLRLAVPIVRDIDITGYTVLYEKHMDQTTYPTLLNAKFGLSPVTVHIVDNHCLRVSTINCARWRLESVV
jgi:hypothetical protein